MIYLKTIFMRDFFKSKKWLLGLIGLVLVALFLAKLLFFSQPAVKYLTVTAQKGDIEQSVLASGILKPQRLVAVGARATGRILHLHAMPGTMVQKGQLLAQIDPTAQQNYLKNAQAVLNNYEAKLAQQEVQLKFNQDKLNRAKTLLHSNTIMLSSYNEAEAQLEMSQAEIKALKAQIAQAQIGVQTAKLDLDYTNIKAPISGTVLARLVQEGQNINAVQSVPTIVILGDLSRMRVYAQISEADISHVKVGQEVYFTVVGNPSKIYKAKLEILEPAPESIRSDISFNASNSGVTAGSAIYYNGIFTIDNSAKELLTYMSCEVHILLGSAHNVVLVPADALQNLRGDKAQLLVKMGSDIVKRDVTIGLNNKVMVEIKSGLQPGEEVVTGTNDGSVIDVAKYSHHHRAIW